MLARALVMFEKHMDFWDVIRDYNVIVFHICHFFNMNNLLFLFLVALGLNIEPRHPAFQTPQVYAHIVMLLVVPHLS